jgi:Tfp pilus assembly protein PilF
MGWPNRNIVTGIIIVLVVAAIGVSLWLRSESIHPEMRAAQEATRKRDFEEARQHLEAYLKENPTDRNALLLAAQTARRRGAFGEASQYLQTYRENNGSGAVIQREEQLAVLQQGDLAAADNLLADWRIDPNSPDSLLILEAFIEGSLLELAPKLAAEMMNPGQVAAVNIERPLWACNEWLARTREPAEQRDGHIWRGKFYSFGRDYPNAAAEIRAALRIDAEHFEARRILATILFFYDPAEAVDHLRLLQSREPANQQVALLLATSLRSLGRYEEAQIVLDEFLAAAPMDPQALLERGNISLDARRGADAERFLRRALPLDPQSPEVNHALARSLQLQGKDESARFYFDQYLKWDAERRRQAGQAMKKPVVPGKQ